jgi:hypothetical protein
MAHSNKFANDKDRRRPDNWNCAVTELGEGETVVPEAGIPQATILKIEEFIGDYQDQ